jgi:F420-dependent oxidoreductase-like protein
MRFSVWPAPTQSFADVLEIARHAEAIGFDGFWYADHFMPDGEATRVPFSESWTTLAGIAAAVPRIRIGPLVTGNTYRHPAVLAKMAATVDHLSGGRLVLGLGAGWQENEHRQYGIPFYTVRERLERLSEAAELIQLLFANETTTWKGKHYALENAVLEPKPVQKPLPILIGGGGEKVTLRIAARFADEWNVWGDVERLRHKMAILDGYCAELGRDPRTIQRSAVALLFLTDDRAQAEKLRGRPLGRPAIIGNADEVREVVRAYREAGVDELVVPDFTLGPREQKLATLERFIREVASPLR